MKLMYGIQKSNVPRKMGKGFFKIPKILFEGRSNFFMKYMNWIQVWLDYF